MRCDYKMTAWQGWLQETSQYFLVTARRVEEISKMESNDRTAKSRCKPFPKFLDQMISLLEKLRPVLYEYRCRIIQSHRHTYSIFLATKL